MRMLGRALVVGGVLLAGTSAWADSLWERRDPRFANLFWDYRARRVGDVLTVTIAETTGIDNNDERNMEKKTTTSGNFTFTGETKGNRGSRKASADFEAEQKSERKFEGTAEFTSDRTFNDRMTVTVVDVQPNGNLVIEGYRKRVVAGEVRLLQLSGVVRPASIGPNNTVQSQYIANFTIRYVGKGPESSYTNNGWMGKIMNVLWPF